MLFYVRKVLHCVQCAMTEQPLTTNKGTKEITMYLVIIVYYLLHIWLA